MDNTKEIDQTYEEAKTHAMAFASRKKVEKILKKPVQLCFFLAQCFHLFVKV